MVLHYIHLFIAMMSFSFVEGHNQPCSTVSFSPILFMSDALNMWSLHILSAYDRLLLTETKRKDALSLESTFIAPFSLMPF